MNTATASSISEEIINLYQQYGGSEYAGERVSQLEHMVQAAQLAEQQGYDEEVILAAFLHDIGHICVSAQGDNEMDGFGIVDHESVGADFLKKKGFSKKLIRLVESHVEAKRYLTFKDPAYYEQLSEASKTTLEYQGGRMEADEAAAFEQYPLFDLIIRLRKWDEEAKIQDLSIPPLAHYREMMTRHLIKNSTSQNQRSI
jgi:phosphonate degradation associated HDIG domain protein